MLIDLLVTKIINMDNSPIKCSELVGHHFILTFPRKKSSQFSSLRTDNRNEPVQLQKYRVSNEIQPGI